MKQIRKQIFETNSSSVHTITICTKEEFKDWQNGEYLLDYWNDKLIAKNDVKDDFHCYKTYDEWSDTEYESYVEEYTSPSGDEIVIFGLYGHD